MIIIMMLASLSAPVSMESTVNHNTRPSCPILYTVRQVAAWSLDPSMTNLRIEKKETEDLVGTKESAISIALITAITTVPCPKIHEDWRQVFKGDVPTAYEELRQDLDELQMTIDGRNKNRAPNVDFHPKHCAISISW